MDAGAEPVQHQQGNDIVNGILPQQNVTRMSRPKAAILQEIRERLRIVKKEMNRTEDIAKKKRKRLKPMTLTKHSKEIACIIHDLEYPAWGAAEEYLLRYMRKRGVSDKDCIDDLRSELNSEYHGASEDDLARWRSPKTPADQRKQKEAKRFISELSVHDWLQHSNKHLGKAPTSAQVMAKYVLASQCHPKDTNHHHVGKEVVAMTPKTRSFLKRWRRRWAVKYRKLPLGPTLTEADCQKKAILKMYSI
jgi:hypothetical protein